MKILYDSEIDALSIRFIDGTVTTKHLAEGIALDYDENGHLAGIEILDAMKKVGTKQMFNKIELESVAFNQ